MGADFAELSDKDQDALLSAMQQGEISGERWAGVDAKSFFERRILVDVPPLYYGHPEGLERDGIRRAGHPRAATSALTETGRDPWEAIEATPGQRGKG